MRPAAKQAYSPAVSVVLAPHKKSVGGDIGPSSIGIYKGGEDRARNSLKTLSDGKISATPADWCRSPSCDTIPKGRSGKTGE